MHKFSIKEARFIFQKSQEDPAKVEAPGAAEKNETDPTKPHRKTDGSFLNSDGNRYDAGTKRFTYANGRVVEKELDVAKIDMESNLPLLKEATAAVSVNPDGAVPPATPERAAQKRDAGADLAAKPREALLAEYLKVKDLGEFFDKTNLKNVVFSDGTIIAKDLLDGKLSYIEGVLKVEVKKRLEEVKGLEELAKKLGGKKGDFIDVVTGIKVGEMVGKIKASLGSGGSMEYLKAYMDKHPNKISRVVYSIKVGATGNVSATLSLNQDESPDYFKFVVEQKAKAVPAAPKPGEKPPESQAKRDLRGNPLLKALAGWGLFEPKPEKEGEPDGYDKILSGEVSVASVLLGILGWKEGEAALASAKGMAPGRGGEILDNLGKQFNTDKNPLSAKGAAKQRAKQTGKPTEVVKGQPPVIAHKDVTSTDLFTIVKDKKMPSDGVRLAAPMSVESVVGTGKILKVDLNGGGKFSLPEKAKVKINGGDITVDEGIIKSYEKDNVKDGILLISGDLPGGIVIDGQVKLEAVEKTA